MKFEELYQNCLTEMAATYKDVGSVKQTISDIKSQNLPHHYQKPLVAIADDADRDEMIDKIMKRVFGDNNFNPDINTKKELQDALEKAVIEVSKEPGTKFKRPVVGVAAGYLGRWLGTNINVEYSRSGSEELKTQGVSTTAAKEILYKTLTPTEQEKEEIKQEEPKAETQPAAKTSNDNPLNQEYSFEEYAFEQFKETINKSNKRNARYGIPTIQVEELGEEFVDVKERAAGTRFFNDILSHTLPAKKIRKVKFKLVVPELKIEGGWEFIGRVDHEAIGNLIVSVPGSEHGVDLHKMFGNSEPSYCDHCNTTRRRTSTFVLKNAEGKIKRVGRQCLKDYLPGGERGVSEVVGYAQYLSDIAERLRDIERMSSGGDGDYEEGMGGGGSSRKEHFQAEGIIAMTIAIVKAKGYMSKSQANKYAEQGDVAPQTTAEVIDMMYNDRDAEKKDPKIKEIFADLKENDKKYTQEAKKIIDWSDTYLDKQLEDPYNKMREYYQNLSTIIKGIKKSSDAHIPKKYLGYLVSIIPLYNKHVDSEKADARLKEQGEKVSEYVGAIGMPIGKLSAADKRKIKQHNKNFPNTSLNLDEFPFNGPIPVTVNSVRTFQRQTYSYYDSGVSTMYSMTDDNGNVYVYFSSFESELNEGEKAKIVRATVKNHKDYTTKSGKTIKQTYLTRVKFE